MSRPQAPAWPGHPALRHGPLKDPVSTLRPFPSQRGQKKLRWLKADPKSLVLAIAKLGAADPPPQKRTGNLLYHPFESYLVNIIIVGAEGGKHLAESLSTQLHNIAH